MTLLMLAAGLLLTGLAAASPRAWAGAVPRWRAWFAATSLAGAASFIYLALGLLTAPVMVTLLPQSALTPACRRLLVSLAPGGIGVAGLAAGMLIVSGLSVIAVARRSRSARRAARVEPGAATHERRPGFDVVTVPDRALVAYSVGGRQRQVVLSQGLQERLDKRAVAAVVAHEAAHLNARHERWLTFAAVLEAALWFVPAAGAVVSGLRLSLERWADEAAVREVGTEAVRAALWAAADIVPTAAPTAGMSGAAEALAQRIAMLDTAGSGRSDGADGTRRTRSTLVLGAALTAASGVIGLATVLAVLAQLCTI